MLRIAKESHGFSHQGIALLSDYVGPIKKVTVLPSAQLLPRVFELLDRNCGGEVTADDRGVPARQGESFPLALEAIVCAMPVQHLSVSTSCFGGVSWLD
jgi:hypothetical protein